ncbi:unnamed protein product, partial [Vitis vinifera]
MPSVASHTSNRCTQTTTLPGGRTETPPESSRTGGCGSGPSLVLREPPFCPVMPCVKVDILVSDDGIVAEMRLSATFSTVSLWSLPMPAGIGPESLFPIRSKIRRNGSDVMQVGISPEMPFQSAIMMLESRLSLQIAGEIVPVILERVTHRPLHWGMKHGDWARFNIGAMFLLFGQFCP